MIDSVDICKNFCMLIVAVISQKGGAGKTTLATNLAVAAELAGQSTLVVDLDSQASATSWADSREADTPVVVSAQGARLEEVLATARDHGAALCLIDTAPHAESPALAAARAADIVLIPCRASAYDIRAVAASKDIAELARTPAAAVLSGIPPLGALADDAHDVLTSHGLTPAPVRIGQRTAFVHSATAGLGVQEYEPRGKAAREITRLYEWTLAKAQQPDLLEGA